MRSYFILISNNQRQLLSNLFMHFHMMWLCLQVYSYHVTLTRMILILVFLALCGHIIMGWCQCWGYEPLNHFKSLPTSILDMWNVFEHFHMMWLCIQVYPYHVTLARMILNLVFLALLGHKIMGWCQYWGYNSHQTYSHIHIGWHHDGIWAHP